MAEKQFKSFEDFKAACIAAGFEQLDDQAFPFILKLAKEFDEEICDSPPQIVFQNFANQQGFVFSSGLGNELVHLNTSDPQKASEWGKLISHIEPNF